MSANNVASAARRKSKFSIEPVHTFNELLHVIAVRSAVFMAEQDCPFDEEFDGNDFSALHLVAYCGKEPAACIRARFFADFAKLERLAVLPKFRRSRVAFEIVRKAIWLARLKGYTRIYGHAQDRLVPFWSAFGARPMLARPKLVFSDLGYTEMLLEVEPLSQALTLATDPYVLIRPEGKWDVPGILDQSASRPISSPLHSLKAA